VSRMTPVKNVKNALSFAHSMWGQECARFNMSGTFSPRKLITPPLPLQNSLFFQPPYANKQMQINKLLTTRHVPFSKQDPLRAGPFRSKMARKW